MQVEAGDQRQLLADHLAHAGENFTFAVVEMLGNHRAMQVEVDGVELSRRRDAVDHYPDDALIGILCDMRRRARATGDCRYQFPAFCVGGLDETGRPILILRITLSTSAP